MLHPPLERAHKIAIDVGNNQFIRDDIIHRGDLFIPDPVVLDRGIVQGIADKKGMPFHRGIIADEFGAIIDPGLYAHVLMIPVDGLR